MKKALLLIVLLIVVAASGWFGIVKWRGHVVRRHDEQLYRTAFEFLKNGKPTEAATVISTRVPYARTPAEVARKWRDIEVATDAQLRRLPQLLAIYQRWPESIESNEDASLLLARTFTHSRRNELASKLISLWRDHASQPQVWFALEVDGLLLSGKKEDAIAMLKSRSFEGAADCGRLSRLALLAGDDLQTAWNYLAQACALDPRNTDIRSFRAQILERIGKAQLARVEYVAAHLADPSNLLLRDQLAEFYRRQRNYTSAVEIWNSDASTPVFDYMWVKSFFWSHVAHPAAKPTTAKANELGGLVKFLGALPAGAFWDSENFARISDSKSFTQQRQEIFWLSLLEMLRTGREKDAAELLRLNRLREKSWEPDLEVALLRVLSYRANGTLNPADQPKLALSRPASELHPIFAQLDQLANAQRESRAPLPADVDHLLRSEECFAALAVAAGWSEAALLLGAKHDLSDEKFPTWVAYGWTQALRFNRGNKPALEFAEKQKSVSLELSLAIAELQIAENRAEEGLARLATLATLDSDAGFRAAWLSSLAALDRNKPAEAAQIIAAQPRLSASTTGRELLARIALAEHRETDAEKIYESLAAESAEAKTWLARRAFTAKNWADARRYTDELLQLFPDQMQLRANLEAIEKAERAL